MMMMMMMMTMMTMMTMMSMMMMMMMMTMMKEGCGKTMWSIRGIIFAGKTGKNDQMNTRMETQ
jgi:hypothetical protein